MVTRKLYWEDPYITEFRTTVAGRTEEGILLNETAFYPEGGGQPGDTGTIVCGGVTFNVSNTVKIGDDPLHVLSDPNAVAVGSVVDGKIDWDRRYAHMRFHTAIHIIDAVVHRLYGNHGLITGSQIYTDRARVDFSMETLTMEEAGKIVDSANEIISQNHTVRSYFITREEASSIKDLARTAPGRELVERMTSIRIVEIEGVDLQADGGTHVRSTGEVGRIELLKIENKGRRNKRMIIGVIVGA